MEKLKCKFCGGGELIEMNGTYHCWDCGAKYVIENGELRLLKCKLCIGDLIDCGDHYECDLCGAKYEKELPEKKTPAPAPKVEKPKEKPAEGKPYDWEITQKLVDVAEKIFDSTFGGGRFSRACSLVYSVEKPEEIPAYAKFIGEETVSLFDEIENLNTDLLDESALKNTRHIMYEIAFASFFGAIRFLELKNYANIQTDFSKGISEENKAVIERGKALEYICALFVADIYEKAGFNLCYSKLYAERAAEIFTESCEMRDLKTYCPNIAKFIEFCEKNMEYKQEELTAAYWDCHPEEFEALNSRKAMFEEEREKLLQVKNKAVFEAKENVRAVEKEIEAAEKKWNAAWHRSIRLNFFQKKEKKRLDEEMHEAFVLKHNLEEKLKLREKEAEKNIGNIEAEYSKTDAEVLYLISVIEKELGRNHYPGEEVFVEIFGTEIEKAEEKFRA